MTTPHNPVAAIELDEVSFSYENTPVLQGVNLCIERGEWIGVFGPNGGGKTTLLQLILGFLTAQRGQVKLFGSSPEQMRHKIGYVPQSLRVEKDFPITTLQVVMMGALQTLRWWGGYPQWVKQKALEVLERVQLSHKTEALFGTLSGGEAQRALIARALLNDPWFLVLDEPTANIDPAGERSIYELLSQLNQTLGILMVTHDLQTVLDRVHRLLCVQTQVTSLKTHEICEHFALGLYHTPLTPLGRIEEWLNRAQRSQSQEINASLRRPFKC